MHPYCRQILEFRPACNRVRNDGSNGVASLSRPLCVASLDQPEK